MITGYFKIKIVGDKLDFSSSKFNRRGTVYSEQADKELAIYMEACTRLVYAMASLGSKVSEQTDDNSCGLRDTTDERDLLGGVPPT
jgi:hypothetical protein